MAKAKGADFLAAMEETGAITTDAPATTPAPASASTHRVTELRRAANKRHFGAYLDQPTLERIALLRARLRMDNGQLMAEAVNLLWKQMETERKFQDNAA
jgi:hypothetical protein